MFPFLHDFVPYLAVALLCAVSNASETEGQLPTSNRRILSIRRPVRNGRRKAIEAVTLREGQLHTAYLPEIQNLQDTIESLESAASTSGQEMTRLRGSVAAGCAARTVLRSRNDELEGNLQQQASEATELRAELATATVRNQELQQQATEATAGIFQEHKMDQRENAELEDTLADRETRTQDGPACPAWAWVLISLLVAVPTLTVLGGWWVGTIAECRARRAEGRTTQLSRLAIELPDTPRTATILPDDPRVMTIISPQSMLTFSTAPTTPMEANVKPPNANAGPPSNLPAVLATLNQEFRAFMMHAAVQNGARERATI